MTETTPRPTPLTDGIASDYPTQWPWGREACTRMFQHARQLERDRAELIEALRQIYDNSNEENEWDAVDKLHYNERIAGALLARLAPNRTGGNDQSSQGTPED